MEWRAALGGRLPGDEARCVRAAAHVECADAGHADHRRQLLEQAALNETQDFFWTASYLRDMQWGRIMLGTDEDLAARVAPLHCASLLSRYGGGGGEQLLQSIDQVHQV